jgi:signal recognition particle receptor subunit beta
MAILREATKEVICKIVYHGAGRSGKTTSLLHMDHMLAPGHRGKFISLETPTERTLFFDLLPVKVLAGGYSFRYLLFATPGQEYYHASRRLVLKGADAIVFVVDSQRERMQDNWEAWELLEKNLRELGQRADALPLVLQYNKRDLPNPDRPGRLRDVPHGGQAGADEAFASRRRVPDGGAVPLARDHRRRHGPAHEAARQAQHRRRRQRLHPGRGEQRDHRFLGDAAIRRP